MRAFHNDPKIKEKYLKRVLKHQKADEIIKGQYWEDGKGCAVGCTLHSRNHRDYEFELGIPEELARLQDSLFEGSSLEIAKTFPAKFLEAIVVGSDASKVLDPFKVIVLQFSLKQFDQKRFHEVTKAVQDVIDLLSKGNYTEGELDLVRSSARSSAWSTACYDGSSAAESAARSAESAARSAESAACYAGSAVWSAVRSAVRYSGESAEFAAYDYFVEELLKLLRECTA